MAGCGLAGSPPKASPADSLFCLQWSASSCNSTFLSDHVQSHPNRDDKVQQKQMSDPSIQSATLNSGSSDPCFLLVLFSFSQGFYQSISHFQGLYATLPEAGRETQPLTTLGSNLGTLGQAVQVHSTILLAVSSLDFFLPSPTVDFLLTLQNASYFIQVLSLPTTRTETVAFLPAAPFCSKLPLFIEPSWFHH